MSQPHRGAEPSSENGTRTQFSKSQTAGVNACPTDAALTSFLDETLPEEARDSLSAHVDRCAGCQDRLDRLTNDTEGAVARIKAHSELLRRDPGGSSLEVTTSEGLVAEGTDSPRFPRVPGYDVLELIGKGGMGVVYRARHRRLNRLVALKMISAGIHADPRIVQRFFFEAEVMARIVHPQVVEVFEADVYKGPDGVPVPYLAMELLEGGTLRNILRQGPRSPSEAAALLEGIARAVHSAHLQGIVHRDLKPGNILFGGKADSGLWNLDQSTVVDSDFRLPSSTVLPKVGDFGLAKLLTPLDEDLTTSGQIIGTPAYMAPEQASGEGTIGPEADVYALGTILYEMLVGHPPFQGREPMKVLTRVMQESPPAVDRLRPDLPRDLAAVTMKCLEKSPQRRYRSAEDFAEDLRRFLENRPTTARPITAVERTWRLARRNPTIASLLATLAMVLVVGVASVFALWQRAERTATDERRAKDATKAALQAADSQQARLEFDRGIDLCEDGQVEQGLPHFLRSLELAEATGSSDLDRVVRTNLAAWPQTLFARVRTVQAAGRTRAIAFTKDGSGFVATGSDGTLTLWDAGSGAKRRTFSTNAKAPTFTSLAISPDDQRIVAGSADGLLWVWDASREELLRSFALAEKEQPVGSVASLVFAPDGTVWAADGSNGARRWDLGSGKSVSEAAGRMFRSPVLALAITGDGNRLFLGDRNGFVFEWDTMMNRVTRGWPMADPVSVVALNPDESALALTGPGGRCLIVDLLSNRIDHDLSLLGASGVAVAFLGDLVLVGDGDGNVRALHRVTGQSVGVPLRAVGSLAALRVRPGFGEFAVAAGDTVSLHRPPSSPWQALVTGKGRINAVAFDPPGQRLAVAAGRKAMLFEATTAAALKEYALPDDLLTLHFDTNLPRLLCGARESWLTLPFDDVPKQAVNSAGGAPYPALALVESGRTVVTGNTVGLRSWNAATLTSDANAATRSYADGVRALDLRRDGQELLAATGRLLEFLNPATLQPLRPAISLPDVATAAKYSADGARLLVGLANNSALWLDATTGKEMAPALAHARAVTSVAISPDASILLTGSRDGTARFWDAATGLPLGPTLRHAGPVTAVAFSPTAGKAATGTSNGHALLWATPPAPLAGPFDEIREKTR